MLGPVKTENLVAGDVVLWEEGKEVWYARVAGTVTVGIGEVLECGQVLEAGAETADYDPMALPANAVAILLTRLDNSSGAGAVDMPASILVRPSVVDVNTLSDADAATLAALEVFGIVARDGPNQHLA